MLYPIKFKPIYKTKVWGGSKIRAIKGDKKVPDNCGESWEISAVQGDVSIASNGFLKGNSIEEIVEIYMGELVGDKVFETFGIEFPILLKIIEAQENLSVQVHPDNKTAAERHNAWGKSEIWYILDADKDATLISGFNTDLNSKLLFDAINAGNFEKYVNQPVVKSGEVYYIPAGRLHSLGKGITLVEIQQTSDVTYRVYDYGRVGRELHLDLAEEVIDYKHIHDVKTKFSHIPDKANAIIKNEFFTVNFIPLMNSVLKDYYELDSFVIYYCINGEVSIITEGNDNLKIRKGETVLIPAAIKNLTLIPQSYSELLEVHL